MGSPTADEKLKFGRRLRKLREDKGLSQSDLATTAGLQPSAISHFESGRRLPSFDNLRRLADSLGVSLDALLGREVVSGAGGPEAEALFRELGALSPSLIKVLGNLAKDLGQENKRSKGSKGSSGGQGPGS